MSTANVTVNLSAKVRLPGWMLIAGERERQTDVEGWTPEHDDKYNDAELIRAASCYLRQADVGDINEATPLQWPWDSGWWKPSGDPIRNLVKAGALIAAEIDRLQRVAP